jgi:hypothetical protein
MFRKQKLGNFASFVFLGRVQRKVQSKGERNREKQVCVGMQQLRNTLLPCNDNIPDQKPKGKRKVTELVFILN